MVETVSRKDSNTISRNDSNTTSRQDSDTTTRHDHTVCPFWVGYLLASPIRALFQNPRKMLAPYVRPGMCVMDVGPGMGFFSLPMARLAGESGRVICVDVQERMLEELARRASRAHLSDRITTRVCPADGLGLADLAGKIDFVLAFAVVHEIGDAPRFFSEVKPLLKPGGRVLFGEPSGHVSGEAFQESLAAAERAGLRKVDSPRITRTRAALLENAV